MASSLYDGLDDAIEVEKSGAGSRNSWVLGRTSNSGSPSRDAGVNGIARLVASVAAPTSHTSTGNSSRYGFLSMAI